MSDKNLELSLYLKELRFTQNLTLRDVEKATNNDVSNAYLSQLESGKVTKPSPYILECLSKVYKVPYEDMMAMAGYIHSSKTKKSAVAFFNQHDLTVDEKNMLLEYLKFVRKQKVQDEKG